MRKRPLHRRISTELSRRGGPDGDSIDWDVHTGTESQAARSARGGTRRRPRGGSGTLAAASPAIPAPDTAGQQPVAGDGFRLADGSPHYAVSDWRRLPLPAVPPSLRARR